METSAMDNDTRGWIMCGFSGLACILGASVICIDIPIRLIPSKRNFRIQESNSFLAASLSLSFGVMVSRRHRAPRALRRLANGSPDLLRPVQHAALCHALPRQGRVG